MWCAPDLRGGAHGQYTLSRHLSVRAVRRFQRIHNAGVALATLTRAGCNTDNTTAKDIVDGHCKNTLTVLRAIIFKLQVSVMVKEERLLEEIKHLRHFLEVLAQLDEAARTGQESVAVQERGEAAAAGSEQSVLANQRLDSPYLCPLWSGGGELDSLLL